MTGDEEAPTFDKVANFVREWARVPAKQQITPDTQFERDLGITGDDGSELLDAVQKRFKVNLVSDEDGYRTTFGLGSNEYLFNSEGFSIGMGASDIITLFTNTNPSVRQFTVGQLSEAIQKTASIK